MYCGTYLFYSFPSEYLFRANGYSGVYAGISLRVVPDQIILIPIPIALANSVRSPATRTSFNIIATVPNIEIPTTGNRISVNRTLSTVINSASTINSSRINTAFQISPFVSRLYDVSGLSGINQPITGRLVGIPVNERASGKLTYNTTGNIVGPLNVNESIAPPIFNVAYAANLVPLSVGFVSTLSTESKIVLDKRFSFSAYTVNNVTPTAIRKSISVKPTIISGIEQIQVSRVVVSKAVRIQGLVQVETIQIPVTQVNVNFVTEPIYINTIVTEPDIQAQLRFTSMLLLSGDVLTSIDLWRY